MQCFQQYLEQHLVLIAGDNLHRNSNDQVCMSLSVCLSVCLSVHSSVYFRTIYRHWKDYKEMEKNTEFWVSGVVMMSNVF